MKPRLGGQEHGEERADDGERREDEPQERSGLDPAHVVRHSVLARAAPVTAENSH